MAQERKLAQYENECLKKMVDYEWIMSESSLKVCLERSSYNRFFLTLRQLDKNSNNNNKIRQLINVTMRRYANDIL